MRAESKRFPNAVESSHPSRGIGVLIAGAIVTLGFVVLALDVYTPVGSRFGILHVLGVSLAAQYRRVRPITLAAAFASVLVLVGFVLDTRFLEFPTWVGISNRAVTLVVVWLTAGLAIWRVRADESARSHTERFRATLASIRDAVITTDREGVVQFVNGRAEELTGVPADECLGRPITEIVTLLDENSRAPLDPVQAFSDEAVTPAEKRPALLVARDGRERVVEGTVSSFPPAGAIGPGTVLALRDVTERRRADLALIESERVAYEWLAEIESFYATAPVGLGSLDTSLRYVRVNDRLAEIYGVRPEELLQRSLGETMPEMAAELEPILRRVLTTGEPAENREVRRRAPGESHPRIYLESYFPLRGTGDEIVGVNAVVQDVTELKEAEESLREANQRKSEFLAVLAHELRNPLTAITYGLYVLRLEKENPERVIETTSQLEKQAQKMKQILEDLFDLERIVRGKFKLDREILDFGEIVRASIDSLREDARQKEIALEEDVAANLRVLGDPVRLDQIVTNLVTNAIKFTDVGGHVWVHVTGEADHVLLRVRDTGIGMSPEFLPYAFEPFRQEDVRRREGAHAGLGLGLRLVKSLTALHGGSVSCSSEGRGRGSEFVVRLPLCRRQVEVEGAGPTIERPGGRTARRVLLVEDSRELAEEFTRVLESYGHSVRVSHDAESALASFEDEPPEAALIDIGLPGMNGYELARELRRRAGEHLVLVAVTALGDERDFRRSREAGFHRHFVKPVDIAHLHEFLTRN